MYVCVCLCAKDKVWERGRETLRMLKNKKGGRMAGVEEQRRWDGLR